MRYKKKDFLDFYFMIAGSAGGAPFCPSAFFLLASSLAMRGASLGSLCP
jgi:hypothetical protein